MCSHEILETTARDGAISSPRTQLITASNLPTLTSARSGCQEPLRLQGSVNVKILLTRKLQISYEAEWLQRSHDPYASLRLGHSSGVVQSLYTNHFQQRQ